MLAEYLPLVLLARVVSRPTGSREKGVINRPLAFFGNNMGRLLDQIFNRFRPNRRLSPKTVS